MTGDRLVFAAILFGAFAGTSQIASANDIKSGASPQPRIMTTGVCTPNKTAFRIETGQISTNSTSYIAMEKTFKPITTTAAGCVIIDFNGEVGVISGTSNRVLLRAVITGAGTVAEPPEVRTAIPISNSFLQATSARFIFKSLPAGTYNIAIQWKGGAVGNVFTASRTLSIQYE